MSASLGEPLRGEVVALEPLTTAHASGLWEAGRDESIWTYLPRGPFCNSDDALNWVQTHLAASGPNGEAIFAIRLGATGVIAGTTRYMEVRPADRGLEIGWTWLAPVHQRTAVNTECKLLLLSRAFKEWGAVRVQFKTDSRNVVSQRAIERLGAQREGVLRNHRILPSGIFRHSVYYSILDTEWPPIKARLQERLSRPPDERRD